jgi:hypothetical protein
LPYGKAILIINKSQVEEFNKKWDNNQVALERINRAKSGLATALLGLELKFDNAARQNLQATLDEYGDDYSEMEKLAMVTVEKLKLVNGMDLAAVLMRREVPERDRGKLDVGHPPAALCKPERVGPRRRAIISMSELSNVKICALSSFPTWKTFSG